MKNRGLKSFMLLAALLLINGFTLFWLQGRPISSAWARGLAQPAAIPSTFSYQGILRDANGALVNGQVNLTLSLYDNVIEGPPLYTESFQNINVRDGFFSVVVGDSGTTLDPTIFVDNSQIYLGIAVNGDPEMQPRQRFHPVPWAMQASAAQSAVTAQNADHASTATTADTADNLAAGATAPNITGPVMINGNLDVTGDLKVTGVQALGNNVTTQAIHEIGDSNDGPKQRADYEVSINRYVVEAADAGTAPDTVPISDTILIDLCQDEDGCTVWLGMRNWNTRGLLEVEGPHRFSLQKTDTSQRWWRLGDFEGLDGDGGIEHALIHHDCYITDGLYTNGQQAGDELGFGLLNWYGNFDSVDMVCVLIIED